jgi:hypothetical protein
MSHGFFERLNEKIKLHGDETKHEQTDRWSNRSYFLVVYISPSHNAPSGTSFPFHLLEELGV